ncbi:MAG TPA: L,D-transpeptidase family protein [Hyphomicrobium sp.]|nr:L,D-transpeptidase family protein [Hyphomicrobium sp.]
MQTFSKSGRGPLKKSLSTSALVAAALFGSGIFDGAQAQFFPWNNGGWGGGWDDQPRRTIRRIPRNVEDDGEKINSTLPKPTGPLVLVVSIGKQTVSVYDGTQKIATSQISSGMPGHDSPTGIFSILEKNRYHYSNLYGGAPMPYMERITNSGVAMHEGVVPGYPASHGCIRLPGAFARNLYGITEVGARVIVTQDDLVPVEFSSPHLIAPLPPDEQASNATPVVTAEATTKDMPSVIGVTPAAAAEATDKPRTRMQAAAARATEKIQLAAAITDAENRKTAAIANAKATADAARAAKDATQKARAEQSRLKDAAEKAARDAANGADKFKDFTAKLIKVEVDKLTKEDLDKQSADEAAEETKMLDLADAIAVAKKAAADQAPQIDKAVAASAEADKVAKAANEAVKAADKAIVDAKAALASANAIDERKDNPVSIFISRKTGRLQAKLGMGDPVIDVPVTITNPNAPLGTHVFTALGYTAGEKGIRWNVVTVNTASAVRERPYFRRRGRHEDEAYVAPAGEDADPADALERIQIPKDTMERLAELVKPGSSFIITDYGLSRETSKRTDFIVEPWRSSTAAPVEYEGGRIPD